MLCHGVPIQRNVPHHVVIMQKEEVIVRAQLLTTVHSSCIYGCALCWEHGVSNRTLEERHQPGFGKNGGGFLTWKVVQVREGGAGELVCILACVPIALIISLQ